MTTFSTNVPLPKIPESNASYVKRVETLAKLAGKAPALIQARELLTGTNTYAKILRRFADALIAEAQGGPLAVDTTPPPAGSVSVAAVLSALGEPEAPAAAPEAAPVVKAKAGKAKAEPKVKPVKATSMTPADYAKAAEAKTVANPPAKDAPKAKPLPTLAGALNQIKGTAKPKTTVLTPEERKAKSAALAAKTGA